MLLSLCCCLLCICCCSVFILVVILLVYVFFFFFFKQKTAYEMRISDWSSDVCSSDLRSRPFLSSDCICAALGSRLARMLSRLRFSSSAAFAASSTCVDRKSVV